MSNKRKKIVSRENKALGGHSLQDIVNNIDDLSDLSDCDEEDIHPMQSQEDLSKKAPLPVGLRLADVDIDDGPPPLKNGKPGSKNANAADKFWSDHLEEHEKRAEVPARLDVQEHNKVPRLEEPLRKMAALSKIAASGTIVTNQRSPCNEHRNKSSENICPHCTKQRQMEKKRHHHKSHRSHSRMKKPELKSRVTKSNSRQKTRNMALMSKSGHSLVVERGKKCRCRYCMRVINRGTCTNIVLKEACTLTRGIVFESKSAKRVAGDTQGTNTPNGSARSDYTNSRNSVQSSMHSGTYNSNLSHMSLDHEPMVMDNNSPR